MNEVVFRRRLGDARTPDSLALLAHDVIEATLGGEPHDKEVKILPARIKRLLDNGFDPGVTVDGEICISGLQYGYTDYHLEAARLIFERCGLPTVRDADGFRFIDWIRSKLDYNYYDCAHIVKLYLLCAAYSSEETYLKMSGELYPEMFDPDCCYTSRPALSESRAPMKLTPAIFKDIHRYDYCVEMLRQEVDTYGCWRLHIFDRKSKIEVAVYE